MIMILGYEVLDSTHSDPEKGERCMEAARMITEFAWVPVPYLFFIRPPIYYIHL